MLTISTVNMTTPDIVWYPTSTAFAYCCGADLDERNGPRKDGHDRGRATQAERSLQLIQRHERCRLLGLYDRILQDFEHTLLKR
ncbi:hypothetical protein ACVWYQ_003659 [Bradyrhizobium sp. USDA 3397]